VARALISGAGIAGPTLAYWLARYGMEVTLVESAPRLRTGGYVIDFWGLGFDVADRMGLLPEIRRQGYRVREVNVVNGAGKRVAGFHAETIARLVQDRYVSIARGDLAAAIFRSLDGTVEAIFGDRIARIDQDAGCARVAFDSGAAREFDIVIGADGLHSRTRELVFGAQAQFEKYLGYKVAAFEAFGYRPRDELTYVMYTEVGQQVSRFAMSCDRTLFLFIFADPDPGGPESADIAEQKALLQKRFANSGWECPRILRELAAAKELYFDRVSQIRMGSWSSGRVTLTGDAAFCVSLLAGQGSALAMVAAYILAGEIHRAGGDYASAFAKYQERFEPFVAKKQKAALGFASAFAPKSELGLFIRNRVFNLLKFPGMLNLTVTRELADRLELPRYE